jgi:hypothetical protein
MTGIPVGDNNYEPHGLGHRSRYRQGKRAAYFLGVGGFCFLLTLAVNYGLKFTILGAYRQ